MNDTLQVDESNAVLWLEWRQDVNSNRVAGLFFLGLLMGFALFFQAVSGSLGGSGVMVALVGFIFFPVAFFVVPLLGAYRLARQRMEEDLTLYTGMTGTEIMYGKVARLFRLTTCLYAPLMPGLIVCAVMQQLDTVVAFLTCFAFSLSFCMAALGFIAGAKSMLRTVVLTFFLGIFCLSGLFMVGGLYAIIGLTVGDILLRLLAFALVLFLVLLGAFGAFQVGLRIMDAQECRTFVNAVVLILLILGLFPMALAGSGWFTVYFVWLLTAGGFFGTPFLVLGMMAIWDP